VSDGRRPSLADLDVDMVGNWHLRQQQKQQTKTSTPRMKTQQEFNGVKTTE
jgi:hypothetical protein